MNSSDKEVIGKILFPLGRIVSILGIPIVVWIHFSDESNPERTQLILPLILLSLTYLYCTWAYKKFISNN